MDDIDTYQLCFLIPNLISHFPLTSQGKIAFFYVLCTWSLMLHWLFSTYPVEDRAKYQICMTFRSILYRIGREQFLDFMYTGQMVSFIFHPVYTLHINGHNKTWWLVTWPMPLATPSGRPLRCVKLLGKTVAKPNFLAHLWHHWKIESGHWASLQEVAMHLNLKQLHTPVILKGAGDQMCP